MRVDKGWPKERGRRRGCLPADPFHFRTVWRIPDDGQRAATPQVYQRRTRTRFKRPCTMLLASGLETTITSPQLVIPWESGLLAPPLRLPPGPDPARSRTCLTAAKPRWHRPPRCLATRTQQPRRRPPDPGSWPEAPSPGGEGRCGGKGIHHRGTERTEKTREKTWRPCDEMWQSTSKT